MNELPFLVVHGAVVAKLLVGALAAGCLGLVWRSRRILDAEDARQQLERMTERVGPASEGAISVRGTLRDTAGARWLDCAGERVELEGELHVVRGTRARWRRREPTARHTVVDGDDVIATGRLTRRGVGENGYRDAPVVWVMTPAPATDEASKSTRSPAIELFAGQPAVCARRPGVVALAVALALSYGVLYGVGWAMIWDPSPGSARLPREATVELDELSVRSVAAALPGARDRALTALAEHVDEDLPRTSQAIEHGIALARLRGGCRAEGRRLLNEDLLERAYDVATRCDDRELAVEALLELGRYAEAAAIGVIDLRRFKALRNLGTALIGSGRWQDAAALLEAHAAWQSAARVLGIDAQDTWVRYAGPPYQPNDRREATISPDPILWTPSIPLPS